MGETKIFSGFFMNRIGAKIISLDEVDSTNLYAERLLESGSADEGTVITARFQSAGRGLGTNIWVSERGMNLMASVILRPSFLPPGDQFLLNKAMTLAVCDVLSANGIVPSVKWPNDIYSGGKKIAGLLISHRVSGNLLDYSIVGIGLNLNQERFPDDLPYAVSLKMVAGVRQDPDIILAQLNRTLDHRYDLLKQGKTAQIETDYLSRLKDLGKWVNYSADSGDFTGKILGVDEFGRLIIERRDGNISVFSHGEITLPPSSI
jgi:BirA family transcriptional regulator, biotin operon repressor / biotin---[acetyl-CoA-carboxylase] ligase